MILRPPTLRVATFNDVYILDNLPKVQTFLRRQTPRPDVVCLCGDFLSPSILSSLDNGRGMVATLRSIGLTHTILGNHEADLKLNSLEKRLQQLQKSVSILNSNVGKTTMENDALSSSKNTSTPGEWLRHLPSVNVVKTSCGRVSVGLMGLLTDDPQIMRGGTFRGLPITNVCTAFSNHYQQQQHRGADWYLPLTHQSLSGDLHLARHMLTLQRGNSVILGGHEHVAMEEIVTDHNKNGSSVRIFKSGQDAQAIRLMDLSFDIVEQDQTTGTERRVQLAEIQQELFDITHLEPSVFVQQIVDSHMELLHALDNEPILHAVDDLLGGAVLSSERTRYQQTTVGAFLCTALKEELSCDVAIFNGAPIKGNRTYPDNVMTYSQLKAELPFPAKIVVVSMTRRELLHAIEYSRTNPPGENVERRGYLQVDLEFDRVGFDGNPEDVLEVALPRNLLKGFCKIQPLMDVKDRLEAQGKLPSDDDYIPAVQLVTRHCNKEKWYEIVHEKYTFEDLDVHGKGYLTRDDVRRMLKKAHHHEPPDFVIDDMIEAIDTDANGVIDNNEFAQMLAVMEREHGLLGLGKDKAAKDE